MEFYFDPLAAPCPSPEGMTHATELISRLICFVSFLCGSTHKVWYKTDFLIKIKRYLTLLTPPEGRGQKNDVARPIHVRNSHTKFG